MKNVYVLRPVSIVATLLVAATLTACGGSSADSGTPTTGATSTTGTTTGTDTTATTLAISGTPTATIEATQTYSFHPSVTAAADATVTYSVQNAPSWATFSTTTGELTGTPSAQSVGTYANIIISASDGTTTVALPAFSVVVAAATTATTTAAAATVTISATPTSVTSGSAATLKWSSTGASSCAASGGWTGNQSPTGTASTGKLTATKTFTLTCLNSAGKATAQSATVTVTAAAPPTSTVGTGTTTSGSTTSGGTTTGSTTTGSTTSGSTTTGSTSSGSTTSGSTTTTTPQGSGGTPVFSYTTGFSSASGIKTAWEAGMDGSAINLTVGTSQHRAGAAWYTTQQDITSFTTDFTFKIGASGYGITFCIQTSNASVDSAAYGTNATGDANMLGYGGYLLSGQYPVRNSVAVKFDGSAGNATLHGLAMPSATGLYIDGGPGAALLPEVDLSPSGINMGSGDTMEAHMVYDGQVLTMTLRDTVTGAQYRTSWPVDIPSVVGGNTAWIGFTGGTIPAVPQEILTWSFSKGFDPRLATPTFSVTPGTYASAQSVSISAPSGSTVYYTTNGQAPTTASTQYTGPITVSSSEVVQAVAVQTGKTDSTVAIGNYQIAAAGTPLINFASGFSGASNLITVNGASKFSGSTLALTQSSDYFEAGAAWYAVPVNVQKFTTSFTMNLQNSNQNGITFTIQNQTPTSADSSSLYVSGGPNALVDSADLGYSGATNGTGGQMVGLTSSVAVKFDLSGGQSNTTGVYTNGADTGSNGVAVSGVSLTSGHPINVTLTYDGTTLSMTLKDTTTSATYTHSWTVNIPSAVGGNTAYVGFTAGSGWGYAQQNITSWTYAN